MTRTSTPIGRRIERAIFYHEMRDPENCLINLFPAIDATAKKRAPPNTGVGKRIKDFIGNEEGLISIIGTNNLIQGMEIEGITFAEAIYKYGRTSVLHEGQLDPRLDFSGGDVSIGHTWSLNRDYLYGMICAVILAPENREEISPSDYRLIVSGKDWTLGTMWGERRQYITHIRLLWAQPELNF
ncbi:hypothetical protein [Celeribacter halophilus]|uniref:hypothetical protein n=1 Tax=Celeribacter halophilus TaxID=576117 RepID=UPI003A937971